MMSTECSYDYVFVYNGDSFESPLIGSFSGKSQPQQVTATSGAVSHQLNFLLVNKLCVSVHTVKKNAETLVAAAKEIGLEVNADKIKYMVVSRDQRAGRNHSVKIDSNSFEGVEEFKYLGTTLTNQNCIKLGAD